MENLVGRSMPAPQLCSHAIRLFMEATGRAGRVGPLPKPCILEALPLNNKAP